MSKWWIGVACLAIICVWLVASPAQTALAQDAGTVARVVAAVNAARIANGLPPYALNPLLTLSAQRHSEYQASIGQWTHTGPDGSLALQRALAVGYPAIRANENVFAGHVTPEEAVNWWLTADPAHRNNVLHPAMREIGVGAAQDANGTIYYTMDISAQPNVLPVFINSDAYSTADPNVVLTLTNENIFSGGPGQIGYANQVIISNSPDFARAAPQGWAQYINWSLDTGSGSGQKTVYVRFIDGAGRTANSQDSIVLDPSAAAGQPAPPPAALPTQPPAAPLAGAAGAPVQPVKPPTSAPKLPTRPPTATPTATPQPAVAQREVAPTLDFSDSEYMKARRGQAASDLAQTPETGSETTVLGMFLTSLRPIMIGALVLGLICAAGGSLGLIRSRRSRSPTQESSADGDG